MSPTRPRTSGERFLITGAHGCIGAWAVRQLVTEGVDVVALDVSGDPYRLGLLLSPDELSHVTMARTDITDLGLLERTLDEHAITNVIHLAALQVPFCRADPSLGARVNVVGTVNVLEAVARRHERMAPVVYASSIAAYEDIEGENAEGRLPSADAGIPATLYGVYKRANEGSAAVYWRERGLSSAGLRPHTVYGPGRDQGVTSAPTVAMHAAASGVPFHIPYGGRFQFQYAPDVARAFIEVSRAKPERALVHNLAGPVVEMSEVVAAIEAAIPEAAGSVTYRDQRLPFPDEVDAGSLATLVDSSRDTSLADGVSDTIARFKRLLADGRLARFTPTAESPVAGSSQSVPAPSHN